MGFPVRSLESGPLKSLQGCKDRTFWWVLPPTQCGPGQVSIILFILEVETAPTYLTCGLLSACGKLSESLMV